MTGLPGKEKESPDDTIKEVLKLGRDILKVPEPQISACHRLSKTKDSTIVVRFVNLHDRDQWLSSAGQLKNFRPQNSTIGISPNLPPILGKLRKNIFTKRTKLSPDEKKKAKVRYSMRFPYIYMTLGEDSILPDITKDELVMELYNSYI